MLVADGACAIPTPGRDGPTRCGVSLSRLTDDNSLGKRWAGFEPAEKFRLVGFGGGYVGTNTTTPQKLKKI